MSLDVSRCQSKGKDDGGVVQEEYHLIQAIPYILVLAGGILGLNVFLVLITGIISGSIIMIATGMIVPTDLLGNMGDGAAGMFETSMVAILVASICALIKEYGGFAALLYWIKKVFKGRKGVQDALNEATESLAAEGFDSAEEVKERIMQRGGIHYL